MTDEYYLDTNFFLYSSNTDSPFYQECLQLVNFCQERDILLSTSAETFQEIIHYSQNIKQLSFGLKTAVEVFKIVDKVYPINKETIERFLNLIEQYSNRKSRDVLHLSVCVENKIDYLITLDRDFKKFKEVRVLKPDEVLNQI